MAIIKSNPTSPGRRHLVRVARSHLHKGSPYSYLLRKLVKSGGRNNGGRITTRHIGGGHKRHYRLIDFKRDKDGIQAKVERLEYDPNRSADIALLLYQDGERRYILAPKNLRVGDYVQSGTHVPMSVGNSLPIYKIPPGSIIHNIEISPGGGGKLVRSAGAYAQVISCDIKYVLVRLRSGELRKIQSTCRATLGEIGNAEHMLRTFGKAGSKRWLGVRPTVRGTAMNPIDHPHGGGEGRNFGKHPVSPFGICTKGKKTRSNKRTDRYILHHRTR